MKKINLNLDKMLFDKKFLEKINENLSYSFDRNISNNGLVKKLIEDINKISLDRNNEKDNYIILKINIDKENEEIFLKQFNTYKLFKNFEPENIKIIIDNELVPVKYKNSKGEFKYNPQSIRSKDEDMILYNLKECYDFYWKFPHEGIYIIKIIFKKKLYSCEKMFYNCKGITEIDLSSFDCSQVSSCKEMFYNCVSVQKINFGKNDLLLSNNFDSMFYNCKSLEELDISNFNTKNCISFESMFESCSNLKKIDVSKFNSSQCITIKNMFKNSKSLSHIDLLYWDMSNIGNDKDHSIDELFTNCKKLKKIKMSCNFGDIKRLMVKENRKHARREKSLQYLAVFG